MKIAIAIAAMALALGCRAPAPRTNTTSGSSTPPAPPASNTGILPGVGTHHHPIATTNPEAQKFFDQGMALVFGFNHEEATRSFQRAAELDPRAPMPHWGIAWSVGPNYNLDIDDPRATRASRRSIPRDAPGRERLAGRTRLHRGHGDALLAGSEGRSRGAGATIQSGDGGPGAPVPGGSRRRHALRRKPDESAAVEVWTLDGKPAEETPQIVAVLESVMKRAPNHMGANHYYIHAVEASTAPGTRAAERGTP